MMADDEVPDRQEPTRALIVAALLFEVARADYHLDDIEVALLRELLHVGHSDFIRAKLQVQEGAAD